MRRSSSSFSLFNCSERLPGGLPCSLPATQNTRFGSTGFLTKQWITWFVYTLDSISSRVVSLGIFMFCLGLTLVNMDSLELHLQFSNRWPLKWSQSMVWAFHGTHDRTIKITTLRIIGPSYGGVWPCIGGFWDLQTTSFEIPWFLG